MVPYEELAAASAGKPAAEKEEKVEARNEVYMRVGTRVMWGVPLASVLDNPGSAAAVTGASVSQAVRFR